ncbi:hypothetical protein [Paractinoplanes toevensis]|uniref:Uncharacterized protein n=1 Tax=Paractinoplanes toevensis TaxID=571911 RepID=A0A919W2R2_9ACTN|nr:hypothetical protein [Actinoplanes toevensis]GIM91909.1 hypothetical protein Ato02nite_037020 [Actinoplanes toevensis]
MSDGADLTCPSWTCQEGAVVIGLIGPDGRLGYLRPTIPVDAALKRELDERGDPLRRVRFADRCITTGCDQWTGSRCGLADHLVKASVPEAHLPHCAIRATCRWYAQNGRDACRVCPFVVYAPGLPSERT